MPNAPYLDKTLQWRLKHGHIDFKEPGYRETAEAILSAGLATEVVGLISGGKEADVYLARYRGAPLAIKAYRLYRTSHRGGRPIKLDTMSWIAAFEYEMLHRAWKAGALVPTPARRVENLLAMRYLGTAEGPAPRLKDVRLEDPGAFLEDLLRGIEHLTMAGVVHGDLSAYNVLVHDGRGWFIDFADGVRAHRLGTAPWRRLRIATEVLTRGMTALDGYFRKYGLAIGVEPFVERLIERLDVRGVLK